MATWDDLLKLVQQNQDQPYWGGVSFPPEMEGNFQQEMKASDWYSKFREKYGEEPNLDTENYNTRRAWFNGIQPKETPFDTVPHWTSRLPGGGYLKAKNHPTAWMNTYSEMTGKDPMVVQQDIYKKLLMGR